MKPTKVTLITSDDKFDILNKYSDFHKLQRVIAYCLKFKEILKNKRRIDKTSRILTVQDLKLATIKIIFLTQRESFRQELKDLQENKKVNRKSVLLKLNPFLDNNGLIRLGGRLKHATIPYEHKCPYAHHITQLIVKTDHERLLHCGPEQLLASLRTNYWPLSGRRLARKITHNLLHYLLPT